MKLRITVVALMAIFLSSCKTGKATTYQQVPAKEEITEAVTVVEEKPVAVLSPVAENPETIAMAATYDGKNLYDKNCVDCHKVYQPSDYTKEKWVPIMKRMQKKARITDAETLAIYNYLTAETK